LAIQRDDQLVNQLLYFLFSVLYCTYTILCIEGVVSIGLGVDVLLELRLFKSAALQLCYCSLYTTQASPLDHEKPVFFSSFPYVIQYVTPMQTLYVM